MFILQLKHLYHHSQMGPTSLCHLEWLAFDFLLQVQVPQEQPQVPQPLQEQD
jgi:hypothetical protein